MNSILKRDTKGSITVEASITFPILLIAILMIITYFNVFNIQIKVERSIHAASKELILDYSNYELFKGIVENMVKKDILKRQFIDRLNSELEFRKIEDEIENIKIDFTHIFNYGDPEGYLECEFGIKGIRFSDKVYLKAIGEGVIREEEWEDIWHLAPMLRGRIIIDRFGGNLGKYFELISRFKDGEACVIKSMDPDSDTYHLIDAIYKRIQPYIERLFAYNEKVNGNEIIDKKLILIVPKDSKNSLLTSEILKIMADCENRGILFECIRYGSLYK